MLHFFHYFHFIYNHSIVLLLGKTKWSGSLHAACWWYIVHVGLFFYGWSPMCFWLPAVREEESAQSCSQSLYVSVMSVSPGVGRFEPGHWGGVGGFTGFTASNHVYVFINSLLQRGREQIVKVALKKTKLWALFYSIFILGGKIDKLIISDNLPMFWSLAKVL